MPTATVEDYLKAILSAQSETKGARVAMGRLAESLHVTPGTVTTMVKTLQRQRFVSYKPRAGVRLTARGRKEALSVLRRHRLIEAFLVEVLKLPWSEVHEEAEVLEHAVSERVLERIDALLGHPPRDPHGDPIPRDGHIDSAPLSSLATCEPGLVEIVRVRDQDPQFLLFAEGHGLVPGAQVKVRGRDAAADLVKFAANKQGPATIGLAAAAKILVTPS